jgi:IS30 family transposase
MINFPLSQKQIVAMNKYNQLSVSERHKIEGFLSLGLSRAQIACHLGRSKSTITREVSRNRINQDSSGKYKAAFAQKLTEKRRELKRQAYKLTDRMERQIRSMLRREFSPDQIKGKCEEENIDMVSHETIYKYVYRDKREGGDLYKHLRRRHRQRRRKRGSKYKQRGKIPDRVSIHERPKGAENRTRYGHWEGDTIIGKGHKGVIVSLTERKSRYQVMIKLRSKKSRQVSQAIIQRMKHLRSYFKTITFDNGLEFADHKSISETLGTEVYFADPYSAWQRGLNENQNGLFRQYVPKSTNLKRVSQQKIDIFTRKLNHRPRKGLGYKTPFELFINGKVALGP